MDKEKIYMSLSSANIALDTQINSVNSQVNAIIMHDLNQILIKPGDKLLIKNIKERIKLLDNIKSKIKSLESTMINIYDAYTYVLELEKDLIDDSN